jgi:tetratricopeptide (TPR) repeat protein
MAVHRTLVIGLPPQRKPAYTAPVMNTRAAMLGGVALLLAATGAATWGSLSHVRPPPAVPEIDAARLPLPPLPPRISEGAEYDKCLALLSGDPGGARALAEAWQARGGGDGAAHCLGLSRIAGGKPEAGAAILDTLASASQASAAVRATLYSQAAQAWMMAGQPRRAEQDLTQALALAPGAPDLLVDRAAAAIALKSYGEAVTDLSAALSDDPRRVDALVMRATALRQLGRLDAARDDIGRALHEAPDSPEALLERGILRQRARDPAGARADWNRVLALAPDGATADLAEQNLALLDAGPPR